jgi:3(or 17)beta-hydroxysteroid dehydrogenase
MTVNAEGTLLGCRFGIESMKKRGGAIVNVGSLSSLLPLPGMVDYGSSKAVIGYLTRTVALDCLRKRYRIRCNSVTPGAILTPLWDSFFSENDQERLRQMEEVQHKIPMKEWGLPADVAWAVLYLASDEARHVTGADILVDGGQYINGQVTRGK